MNTNDEQVLLRRLRDGDVTAFAAIDDRYRRPLTRFAARLTGSVADAEDVVQEALIRAYHHLPGELRRIDLTPWLYRVVHNACLDHLRHRRRMSAKVGQLACEPFAEDVHSAALRRERLAAIVDDIRELPARQKDAVVLACIEGLSHAEVAECLDSTVPATKSLLKRARSNLARMAAAREALADTSRRTLAALLAPAGKLFAPVAALTVVAVGAPAILVGAGEIVGHQTVTPSAPAPRPLLYGPFRVKQGSPVPDEMLLEEVTVQLPGGEAAPEKRRLSVTCPLGYVHTGVSISDDQPEIAHLRLTEASGRRMGRSRTAVIAFRPKADMPGPYALELGVICETREHWRRVSAGYGIWAECKAIRKEIRRLRSEGHTVARGLMRARRIDCREWRAFMTRGGGTRQR